MTMMKMAIRTFCVALAVAALSACVGPGVDPDDVAGDEPQAPNLSQIDIRRVAQDSAGADELDEWDPQVQPYRAYYESLTLMWWADEVLSVLQEWTEDEPANYTHSGTSLDVAWGTDGTTWSWEMTGGEVPYKAEVSDDQGAFLLVVYLNGEKRLEGTIAPDATTGTLRASDLINGDEDRVSNFSWKPSTKPDYDWHISIAYNDYNSGIDETMEIWTTADGSEGEYSGTVSDDPYEIITWGQ